MKNTTTTSPARTASSFTAAISRLLLALLGSATPLFGQLNWTLQFTGISDSMAGVAYANGQFGAVSTQRIVTSPDGASWTPSGSAGSYVFSKIRAMQHTGDYWFAKDMYGSGRIYLSTTLPSMAHPTLPGNQPAYYGAASGNGTLVVVGGTGQIRTSTNGGSSWLIAASPTQEDLADVVFDGTSFVALGRWGCVLQSTTGLTWTIKRYGANGTYEDLEVGQGAYVAVGSGRALRSTDLVNWTEVVTWNLNAVDYANGRFVAVGDGGLVAISSDGGLTWASVSSGVSADLRGIAYGGGYWVAVGGSGLVIRAPDQGAPSQDVNLTIHQAVEIRWLAPASKSYQVKWSYNMVSWYDFGVPIVGDGTMKSVFDSTRGAGKKFYRIVQTTRP